MIRTFVFPPPGQTSSRPKTPPYINVDIIVTRCFCQFRIVRSPVRTHSHNIPTYVETGRGGVARTVAIIIAYTDSRHGNQTLEPITEQWKSIFSIHSNSLFVPPSPFHPRIHSIKTHHSDGYDLSLSRDGCGIREMKSKCRLFRTKISRTNSCFSSHILIQLNTLL